jgi:hypothetical protein
VFLLSIRGGAQLEITGSREGFEVVRQPRIQSRGARLKTWKGSAIALIIVTR